MKSRLLITAGPTREPIDAVRFISNRSSGRLGIALAEAALRRDVPTTLLLGPTSVDPPQHSHLRVHRFRTTADLETLLAETWPEHDVLIMAAAVADFRPVVPAVDGKLSRAGGRLTLELEPTPDLVASLPRREDQTIIGFALAPADRLAESAARKLETKNLDAIVANPLATMDATEIDATLLLRDGRTRRPPAAMSKPAFAEWLLDEIARLAK